MEVKDEFYFTSSGDEECVNLELVKKIKLLPFEDTVWTVKQEETELDSDDEDHKVSVVVSVMDSRGRYLGVHSQPASSPINTKLCVAALLIKCLFSPLYWKPRRPRFITADFSVPWEEFMLPTCDITTLPCVNSDASTTESQHPMKSCVVCRRRGSLELFITCSECMAVYYCSDHCASLHSSPDCPDNHAPWCQQMKALLQLAPTLKNKFFTFSDVSTAEFPHYLSSQGLHGRGLWLTQSSIPPTHKFGDPDFTSDLYTDILPPAMSTQPLERPLCSWESYYAWRGLAPSSPLAVLLHFSLTLYYIITQCLPDDWLDQSACLNIDVVGVETEADLVPTFYELSTLLSQHTFHIRLYGPRISSRVAGKTHSHDRVTVSLHPHLHHESHDLSHKPDLIVGFNAGLAAYRSWMPTLEKIKSLSVPCYFTDYCQCSITASASVLTTHHLPPVTGVTLNPFRCPMQKSCDDHRLPWYSNAWLYHLVTGPSDRGQCEGSDRGQ